MNRLRILIVEDSPADAKLLLYALRDGGIEPAYELVDTAEGMQAALDRGTWDVVLSDFRMPTFSALAALEIARGKDPDLPFIIISGTIGEETAVGAMRAGANDYFMKGHLVRLVPAIERELKDSAERRARRQTEKDLRDSERKYRSIIETTDTGYVILDKEGRVLDANRKYVRLAGHSELRQILGRSVLEWTAEHARQRNAEAVTQCVRDGRIRHLAIDYVDANGRITPVEINATVEGEGEAARIISLCRDMTAHRQLEAQFRQSQKMEVVGRLAGGVAHDFNNLLTAILGNCSFLLESLPKGSPQSSDVREIESAGKRATDLTHQLLAFSRKQVLKPKIVDVNSIVKDLGAMLRRLIGEDIELRLNLCPKSDRVKADPGQIEQVIMNLAVNARDAMPKGGLLTIETSGAEAADMDRHPEATQGLYVALSVADSGTGMDQETLAHLFEPFFTTKEKGKGTGLGLSTVYGIVHQSGGFIEVQSEPGAGTVFKIYLPVLSSKPEEGTEHGEGMKPGAPSRGRTVLLVEDDEIVRRMTGRVLRNAGYAVLEAPSSLEALKHAGQRIDIVLTDVVLPDFSGVELAARLKGDKPSLEVVYMSGYTDNLVLREILSRPTTRFLQKPFTPDALLQKVREALG